MYVKVLEVGDGVKDSIFYNFDDYVDEVASEIMSDPELKDGFTFIGHSQGGVVARSYIERYNNPPALQPPLYLWKNKNGSLCGSVYP